MCLDWLVFCDCGFSLSALWYPLSVPTILLGFLWPWMCGISSQLLTTPAPLSRHSLFQRHTAATCCRSTTNWKILKEMGIPDHLTCLLRNLYAYTSQEATVRTGHGTTNWFKIGKGAHQGCILSPCLFNLYAEYIMRNAGLEEARAEIKISGRNNNNLRYADNTTLMAEKWRRTKKPLDESERGEWKSWLKTQHSEN